MLQLTKAEEQVMQILWQLEEGVVKDIVDKFNKPIPAYTTVATVLKVLEKKGFVTNRKIGNTLLYKPKIQKEEYTHFEFSNLLKNYFNNSFPKMATFFAKENKLSIVELEKMMKMVQDELKKEEK